MSRRNAFAILAAACIMLLTGCAARQKGVDYDPLEPVNRKIFWFNDKLDIYVLEPVATRWKQVVPDPMRVAISRFFANVRFPINVANNLLQGKVGEGLGEVGRFAINTTVGVLGFMDPADGWGLHPHPQDTGVTLGRWGLRPGAYLVLPVLGPSDARDTGGLLSDYALAVYPWFITTTTAYVSATGAKTVELVNERARYLKEVQSAKAAAIDYYSFVRNAYLQRRRALVSGSATNESTEEDLYRVSDDEQSK
jgi:phospholipid-binding lipoprotein MlaA